MNSKTKLVQTNHKIFRDKTPKDLKHNFRVASGPKGVLRKENMIVITKNKTTLFPTNHKTFIPRIGRLKYLKVSEQLL